MKQKLAKIRIVLKSSLQNTKNVFSMEKFNFYGKNSHSLLNWINKLVLLLRRESERREFLKKKIAFPIKGFFILYGRI